MAVLESPGRVAYQRLPGVTFLPRPPARRPLLPRLDVAAFLGFAERGPLNAPVPVEDANVYRAVFGGDLDLARAAEDGVRRRQSGARGAAEGGTVKAHLPLTVEQFFANRGRRCYVVRVAGKRAEAARLRVAGVVALNGRVGPRLAAVSASSPGAWGAGLRLAGRLAVSPLPISQLIWKMTTDGTTILEFLGEALRRSGAGASFAGGVAPGDVLRLRYADGAHYLALVTGVAQPAAAPGVSPRVLVTLGANYEVLPGFQSSPPEEVSRAELLTIEGPTDLSTTGPLLDLEEGAGLALAPADAPLLNRGDMLRLHLAGEPAGDPGYLVRIEDIRGQQGLDGGSPPEATYAARFSEALRPAPLRPPVSSPPDLIGVDLLRLDLLLRSGDEQMAFMSNLAFNPPHPRFWGDAVLLESSPLQRSGQASTRPGERGNPYADSAAWYRRLVRDPYDVLPQSALGPDREAERPAARSFNTVVALAGMLAPVGSHLGTRPADAAASGGAYADAEEELALAYLPLGLPEIIDEADTAQLRPPEAGREGSDDLAQFDVSVFYDRFLAPPGAPDGSSPFGETHRTLMQTAFDLHYVQGRELRGLHSLLFVDEVAVVAAPDACHDPWRAGEPQDAPVPPEPTSLPPEKPCPPTADFAACNRAPVLTPGPGTIAPYHGPWDRETPVVVRGEGFTSSLTTTLLFGVRPAEGVEVVSSEELRATAPTAVRPGPVDVTVQNEHGAVTLAGGFIYTESSSAPSLPRSQPMEPNDLVAEQPFLYVHEALAAFCQARADAICLLSLPQSFDVSRCIEWQQAFRRQLGLPDLGDGDLLGLALDEPTEIADLSYAAVYHPWLSVSDPGANLLRLLPPDGAIAGVIAARELDRQAWVAPANVRLERVLGLSRGLSDNEWAELFARRFNLVRPEAGGFAPMSAHTLSGERDWLQISVRRLMILLRKAAFQLGMDFVFQTNNEVFREGVRVMLEDFLRMMFERGAFAGRTEAESFRVIADATVNPRQSVDEGRLVVVIQVAPSQPMEFITVQLVRSGEGELLVV